MKKSTRQFISLLLLVAFILGVCPFNALADSYPGTAQVPIYLGPSGIDSGVHFQDMRENGVQFPVYCFNSSLHWPDSAPGHLSTQYIPDSFNHLDDTVKNQIYRILYAGYPYNNAGLYVEAEVPYVASIEDIREAIADLGEMMKNTYYRDAFSNPVYAAGFTPLLTLIDSSGDVSGFTIFTDQSGTLDNIESPQVKALYLAGYEIVNLYFRGIPGHPEVADSIPQNHPQAYSLILALQELYTEYDWFGFTTASIREKYSYYYGMFGAVTAEQARVATQYAIWRILYEAGVPGNTKSYDEKMTEGSLVWKLVNFAKTDNSVQRVPDRGTSTSAMELHRAEFETGVFLLDKNNAQIGTRSIQFTKNLSDGLYYSEPLHFSGDAYTLPYTISVLNSSNDVIGTVVNHGHGEFVLVASEIPAGASVSASSENNWPSDVYQYVRGASDRAEYQELSGVYYHKGEVPLAMTVGAIVVSSTLSVEKTVNNETAAAGQEYWFKTEINIQAESGQELEADFPYEKYDIATPDVVKEHGTLHHFADSDIKFYLRADEGIRILDIPVGVTYSAVEYSVDDENGSSLGSWTPEYLTSSKGATSVSTPIIKVRNNYTYSDAESAVISLGGIKILSGASISAGEFNFILWPNEHGYPMPEAASYNDRTNRVDLVVSNGALGGDPGEINFGSIKFSKPGTYTYTIEEQQVVAPNITRDTNHFEVVVTVGALYNADNLLDAQVAITTHTSIHTEVGAPSYTTYTNSGAPFDINFGTFTNIFSMDEIDKVIRVKKVIINESSDLAFSRANYVFDIEPDTSSGQNIEAFPKFKGTSTSSYRAITGISGEAETPVLQFTTAWFIAADSNGDNVVVLPYTIIENKAESIARGAFNDGLAFDTQTGTAVITITSNAGYTAEIKYTFKDATGHDQNDVLTPIDFTNRYSASVTTNFAIEKSFVGYAPVTDDAFSFEIGDDFGRNDPTGYTLHPSKKITLTWNGSAWESTGEAISFTKAGEYRYSFKELAGSDPLMQYDNATWIVDIKVSDNGDGTLSADHAYYYDETSSSAVKTKASFVNKYHSVVTTSISAIKTIEGRTWNDTESFKALIAHGVVTSGYDPLDASCISSDHTQVTHANEVEFTKTSPSAFALLTFHDVGEYFFRIEEHAAPGSSDLDMDKAVYVVTVKVEKPVNDLVITESEIWKTESDWAHATTVSSVGFTNKYTALSVEKRVNGAGADTDYPFEFAVTLDTPLTGNYGQMYFTSGVANFSLRHNEKLIATGLPVGTNYTVTEAAVSNYTATSTGAVGTIAVGTATAIITNSYTAPTPPPSYDPTPLPQVGSLKVTKTVSAASIDTAEQFGFTVTLDNTGINGIYGGMRFENGVASFTLKHGKSATATGLPKGIKYTVEETDSRGYTPECDDNEGTIVASSTKTVKFVNTPYTTPGGVEPTTPDGIDPTTPGGIEPTTPTAIEPPTPEEPTIPEEPFIPKTDDNTMLGYWTLMFMISAAGMIALLGGKKTTRKRNSAKQ